jgi:diaminopimelate epimerase
MAVLHVTKCQGTGNDFVLLDRSAADGGIDYPTLAQHLCDRRRGVGADGLLVLEPATQPGADIAMRIFNADGTEAEMCGNGIRCVARFMRDRHSPAPAHLVIQTAAGMIDADVVEDAPQFSVRVNMGIPEDVFVYDDRAIVGGYGADLADVKIGNPHSIAFLDVDLDAVDLPALAAEIAANGPFADTGVNVEIARVYDSAVAMRVFERGVGETWACGTGACAVAAAAITLSRVSSPVQVMMRGGDVNVAWAGLDTPMYLTGGAELVFDAAVDIPDAIVTHAAAV